MKSSVQLYESATSSCSFRVRIALNSKGVAYDSIPLLDLQRREEYFSKNPQKLVPFLVHGEDTLSQSICIIEYIDANFSGPKLLPDDLVSQARAKSIALYIVCEIQPLQNTRLDAPLKAEKVDVVAWKQHWITEGLKKLEAVFHQKETGGFSHGDSLTIADCCLVPQVWNAIHRYHLSLDSYPKLKAIYENCLALEAVQKALPEKQSDYVDPKDWIQTQRLWTAVQPVVPFTVHSLVSVGAFTAGLGITQLAGYACRISCATPVLGSAVGLLGVGVASAAAGQASLHCRRYFHHGEPLLTPPRPATMRRNDMLLDALLGIVLFKALGGRFRSVMPSDLFAPGAMAIESLPAPSANYATEVGKGELLRLFRRDGCHHCGTQKGSVVGDHIPPNKMVWGSRNEFQNAAQKQLRKTFGVVPPTRPTRAAKKATKKETKTVVGRLVRKAQAALNIQPGGMRQRYYPQCKTCSSKQSVAVKANRRTLVLHFGGPKAPYYAGILVGFRHFQAQGPPPDGREARRRGFLRGRGGGDNYSSMSLYALPAQLGHSVGCLLTEAGKELAHHQDCVTEALNTPHRFARDLALGNAGRFFSSPGQLCLY